MRGVGLELEILKKDAYKQTILSDTGSAVQIKTGLDGSYDVDDSTSLTGSIFSVLISGRTQFSNAIKPSFVKTSNSQEVKTQRVPFIYVEGTDSESAIGGNMRSSSVQAHLFSSSLTASLCPTGYILSPDRTIDDVGSPAVCTPCPTNTYSLDALAAEGCIACPKVRKKEMQLAVQAVNACRCVSHYQRCSASMLTVVCNRATECDVHQRSQADLWGRKDRRSG